VILPALLHRGVLVHEALAEFVDGDHCLQLFKVILCYVIARAPETQRAFA